MILTITQSAVLINLYCGCINSFFLHFIAIGHIIVHEISIVIYVIIIKNENWRKADTQLLNIDIIKYWVIKQTELKKHIFHSILKQLILHSKNSSIV